MRNVRRVLWPLNLVLPFAVILSLWAPILYLFQWDAVSRLVRGPAAVPALPEPQRLARLKTVNAGVLGQGIAERAQVISAAEGLLLGRIDLAALAVDHRSLGPSPAFRPPFDDAVVFKGDTTWQLAYAGFVVPQVLLRAFDATGRPEFLAGARDFILGWWAFEQRAVLPQGLLWNDHAIASRAMVLCEFWYRYRQHDLYRPSDGERIVALAEHTARLLSLGPLYTYRTNHGFMQNVGLAKLALSFPGLRNMDGYKAHAFTRMERQIAFFVGEDGVVLEHSVGYHVFGLRLLENAVTLLEVAGQPVPAALTLRRDRAVAFLQQMLRADGTLPRIGDTASTEALENIPGQVAAWVADAWRPNGDGVPTTGLFPRSGYAAHRTVAERASATHLAVFWSYLPHMGHKHADELSLHLWANGIDWWTAAGYWPYPHPDRERAICWDGSNAPHRLGEPCGRSDRTSRVLASGRSGRGFALDLRRDGPDGFRVRRQVLALDGHIWLTLDSFDDARPGAARIVWLTGNGNRVTRSTEGGWRIDSAATPDRLAVQFLASSEIRPRFALGEPNSTLGWVVDRMVVRPAPAFVVDLPSNGSWALNLSVLEPGRTARLTGPARMAQWRGPADWVLDLPLRDGPVRIVRRGHDIALSSAAAAAEDVVLTMTTMPEAQQTDAAVLHAYRAVEAEYGRPFEPFTFYRVRMTWALAILALLHFGYLAGLARFGGRLTTLGLALPALCWPALTVWLFAVYFVK